MNCSRIGMTARYFALVVVMLIVSAGVVSAQGKAEGAIGKLNLSDAQRGALRAQIRNGRQSMMSARQNLRNARMGLFQQLRQYRIDDKRLQESIHRINTEQRHLLQISLQNQLAIRKILTKDQFAQLGEAIGRGADREREREHERGGWGFGPKDADIDRLGLTDDQENRIKQLFDKSGNESKSIVTRLHAEMGNLHKLYMNYDLDPKRAGAQIDKVGGVEQKLLREIVNRQVQLRRILNEDQFQALARTMQPPSDASRTPKR